MQILVINGGSSSIKFAIFEAHPPLGGDAPTVAPRTTFEGVLSDTGDAESTLTIHPGPDGIANPIVAKFEIHGAEQAISHVIEAVSASGVPAFEAVGYRVVHPGPKLREHTRITSEVLEDLKAAREFAPLHDPEALLMISAFMKKFPALPHYACFDTVFHQTMPEEASAYALPPEYSERGVRRYGFHGLSCESIVRQLKRAGDIPHRVVIAHLGSGCSVTALLDGSSIDTTMGLTPTGGVVMGTRPGDLDPGLVLYLLRQAKGDRAAEVESLLNHRSGMVAVSEMDNDVKAMREASAQGNSRATLALKIFTRSVTKAMGSFSWLLGGLDAIVFAGGIGENDPKTRSEVVEGLATLGVAIDAPLNNGLNRTATDGIQNISSSNSSTAVLVVPAREDQMIAVHVEEMARQQTH